MMPTTVATAAAQLPMAVVGVMHIMVVAAVAAMVTMAQLGMAKATQTMARPTGALHGTSMAL